MIKNKDTIKSSLKGDRQAFALLVDYYKSLVCSLAYCATGNVVESEYIGRCAFVNAWQNFASLDDLNKFNQWLVGIAMTTITAHINRQAAQADFTSPEAGDLINFTPVPTDPTDAAMVKDENLLLWQTLKSLPLECRETLVLYFRYEKSTKQVAELLSISEQAVSQRLAQAKQMLTEKTERRIEAAVRNTSPGEKFTAMVITAVSTIPAGISPSKTGGGASNALLTSLAAKIAAAVIIVAIIAAGFFMAGNQTVPVPMEQRPADIVEAATPQPQKIEPALPQQPKKAEPRTLPQQSIAAESPEEKPVVMFEGILSGRVTDIDTGLPVADALITLTLPNKSVTDTHTDNNGDYKFDALEVYGKCTLAAASKEYAGINCAYGNLISLELDPDTQTIQHIELQKACMLEIEVVDAEDNPINGAQIIITNPAAALPQGCVNPNQGTTGLDGKLLIGGIKPSNQNYTLSISPPQTDCYIPAILTIMLAYPSGVERCKISLDKGCSVEGYVYDNYGSPRTGFTLVARGGSENNDSAKDIARTITDELGYYRFECMPEEVLHIQSLSKLNTMGVCFQSVMPNKNEPTILNFGGGNFVTGRLFLNSQPLANCKLSIIDSTDYNSLSFFSNGETDDNGSFIFSGIPQGKKFLICNYETRHIVMDEIETFSQDLDLGDMNFDSFDNTTTQPEQTTE